MIDTMKTSPAKPARVPSTPRLGLIERMLAPVVFDARPVRRSRIDAALKVIGEGPARDIELDGVLAGLWTRRNAGVGKGPSGPNGRGGASSRATSPA